MFETSESTAKLDEALAKVQAEIKPAIKDSLNPHYKSKYADLHSVFEAIREALTKYEVSVTQWPLESQDNKLRILTRLAHKGEWMRATFAIPVSKQDAHSYGSATTYARRFALSSALCVSSEDDDANGAIEKKEFNQAPKPLGKHIVPEGKHKGKHLDSLTNEEIVKLIEGMQSHYDSHEPPIHITVFLDDAEEYLENKNAKVKAEPQPILNELTPKDKITKTQWALLENLAKTKGMEKFHLEYYIKQKFGKLDINQTQVDMAVNDLTRMKKESPDETSP